MDIYRRVIEEDLDLEGVDNGELRGMLDEAGRDLVYNYLLIGEGVSYEKFIENMKTVLDLRDQDLVKLKEL